MCRRERQRERETERERGAEGGRRGERAMCLSQSSELDGNV